jgi:hypothetical protein
MTTNPPLPLLFSLLILFLFSLLIPFSLLILLSSSFSPHPSPSYPTPRLWVDKSQTAEEITVRDMCWLAVSSNYSDRFKDQCIRRLRLCWTPNLFTLFNDIETQCVHIVAQGEYVCVCCQRCTIRAKDSHHISITRQSSADAGSFNCRMLEAIL